MSNKEGFYIGWQDKMSDRSRSFLRKRLLPLFIVLPILVILLVYVQKPFNNHSFELGKRTSVIGVYHHAPFPMLVADNGQLPQALSNNILLVGYGKFGASGIMESVQEESGQLEGKRITLEGTLIYGDGKTVMELTNGKKCVSNVSVDVAPQSVGNRISESISLEGEILDPKCYFGVMKPGEGKIHKSCAIRCISGGIPPVFRHNTGDTERPYEYYIMLGSDKKKINKMVLPYVGEQISLIGNSSKYFGWNIIYSDTDSYTYR